MKDTSKHSYNAIYKKTALFSFVCIVLLCSSALSGYNYRLQNSRNIATAMPFELTIKAAESPYNNTVFIIWNSQQKDAFYDVFVNSTIIQQNTSSTSTSLSDYFLPGVDYKIRVVCKLEGVILGEKSIVFTSQKPLSSPKNLKLLQTTLSWDEVVGANYYNIYINNILISSQKSTIFNTENRFIAGENYTLKVSAYSSNSNIGYSESVILHSISKDIYLCQPSNFFVFIKDTSPFASWSNCCKNLVYETSTSLDISTNFFSLNEFGFVNLIELFDEHSVIYLSFRHANQLAPNEKTYKITYTQGELAYEEV